MPKAVSAPTRRKVSYREDVELAICKLFSDGDSTHSVARLRQQIDSHISAGLMPPLGPSADEKITTWIDYHAKHRNIEFADDEKTSFKLTTLGLMKLVKMPGCWVCLSDTSIQLLEAANDALEPLTEFGMPPRGALNPDASTLGTILELSKRVKAISPFFVSIAADAHALNKNMLNIESMLDKGFEDAEIVEGLIDTPCDNAVVEKVVNLLSEAHSLFHDNRKLENLLTTYIPARLEMNQKLNTQQDEIATLQAENKRLRTLVEKR